MFYFYTTKHYSEETISQQAHSFFFLSKESKYPRNLPTFRQLHRACRLESDYFQDVISGPVNVYSEKKMVCLPRSQTYMFDIRCRSYFLLYFVGKRFESILYYLQDFLRFEVENQYLTSNIFIIHRSVNSHLKYRSAKSKSVRQYLVSLPEARKFSILYRS